MFTSCKQCQPDEPFTTPSIPAEPIAFLPSTRVFEFIPCAGMEIVDCMTCRAWSQHTCVFRSGVVTPARRRPGVIRSLAPIQPLPRQAVLHTSSLTSSPAAPRLVRSAEHGDALPRVVHDLACRKVGSVPYSLTSCQLLRPTGRIPLRDR